MWQRISTAPFGRDLEIAVVEGEEINALIVPCRREPDGWVNAMTRERIVIDPTHWRNWDERN
jgi:hypothetical protein